jgi:hypothetical protein
MSAENPIVRSVVEIARQILASQGVDVDDTFDLETNIENDSARGNANQETATNEEVASAYDVIIRKPEEAVADYLKDSTRTEEEARQEYAEYLIAQIEAIQKNVIQTELLIGTGDIPGGDIQQSLGDLKEDISGGPTDMGSLKDYYSRLEEIIKKGTKLA